MRRRAVLHDQPAASLLAAMLLGLLASRAAAVEASRGDVKLSYDKLVALGGTITFKAEITDENGEPPEGKFVYKWQDNAKYQHHNVSDTTTNTTSYYRVTYPASMYDLGVYTMEVIVCQWEYFGLRCAEFAQRKILFPILFNGNLTVQQTNYTGKNDFVSSAKEAKLSVNLRKIDYDYIVKKATSITTHWFIDCQYYNHTKGFTLNYNFTRPNSTHIVEALVVASFDPLPTTPAPTTTTSTTPSPVPTNGTTSIPTNMTSTTPTTTTTTTTITTTTTTTTPSTTTSTTTVPLFANQVYPFICESVLTPDPNETYGYFKKEVNVRAPISKLNIDGSTWIQPWNSLLLDITCNGTGPFQKCIEIHVGKYNVTGNETCQDDSETLDVCKFSFTHYFLDALEYTVLVILSNDVSTEIHPVAVNIYKLVPKPQLSVIVVPVSCSLVAVVLIVFGIAYYVQNKSRFTVEVADFDFGQRSADMEYKTFTERLRDSFNNAGYKQLNNAKDLQ